MSEFIVCGINLAFAHFLIIFAQDFPKSVKPNVPSASFFPTIIGVILLGLSIYNLIHAIIVRRKNPSSESKTIQKGKVLQILEILVLLFLYAFLWKLHFGHFIINSIAIFVPVCILLGDEKPWYQSAIFATCLVLFIYSLFTFLLKVRLW
jgi:hypothetical protein